MIIVVWGAISFGPRFSDDTVPQDLQKVFEEINQIATPQRVIFKSRRMWEIALVREFSPVLVIGGELSHLVCGAWFSFWPGPTHQKPVCHQYI